MMFQRIRMVVTCRVARGGDCGGEQQHIGDNNTCVERIGSSCTSTMDEQQCEAGVGVGGRVSIYHLSCLTHGNKE